MFYQDHRADPNRDLSIKEASRCDAIPDFTNAANTVYETVGNCRAKGLTPSNKG